ncbi:hypothetical protein FA15DRAFT_606635 [Coprinopsis marcescibilis]|uniref:Uncharacterized protein n=1 Tax=Coprinopsis marcescibilis TaxID=230819 RepID=A0A5C3K9P7_COPMA|nr:hypothetical protein FA15DRAFT_606635 [Coprinopsis marcescibilis]
MVKYNVQATEYTRYIAKYLKTPHLDHWENTIGRLAPDKLFPNIAEWSELVKAIYESYPGSGTDARFCTNDLDVFVRTRATRPINSMAEFATYWRDLGIIADYLVNNGKILVKDAAAKGIEGLSPHLRLRVEQQLRNMKPEQRKDDGWSREDFLASLSPPDGARFTARHTEPLQTIECLVEGKLKIHAILDDGSQIIGMRRAVWEKLGIPCRSDHKIIVESANKTKSSTTGLLPNLKVTIGDCDFYLQVQVIEEASYDFLLGRPFHTLAKAVVSHMYDSGQAQLTLTDPNTKAIITLPTKNRDRNARVVEVDF